MFSSIWRLAILGIFRIVSGCLWAPEVCSGRPGPGGASVLFSWSPPLHPKWSPGFRPNAQKTMVFRIISHGGLRRWALTDLLLGVPQPKLQCGIPSPVDALGTVLGHVVARLECGILWPWRAGSSGWRVLLAPFWNMLWPDSLLAVLLSNLTSIWLILASGGSCPFSCQI